MRDSIQGGAEVETAISSSAAAASGQFGKIGAVWWTTSDDIVAIFVVGNTFRVGRLIGLLISAFFMCIAIVYPSSGFSETCSGQVVTTRPASSPNPRSYELYFKQLDFAVSTDVDVVLLGDSLAEYWDIKMFNPIKVINLGVAGDRTQDVLWRLNTSAWSRIRTRAVFIMLGTNNLPDDEPCAIIAGLKKVIERVKSLWSAAQVVVLEIPPRGKGFKKYDGNRVEVNAAMHITEGIITINVDDEITCGLEKEGCPNYQPDNLHFTAAGYEIILRRLARLGF
jgi:lysophospholipase L1-like esterase